jgi:hypothetical protein
VEIQINVRIKLLAVQVFVRAAPDVVAIVNQQQPFDETRKIAVPGGRYLMRWPTSTSAGDSMKAAPRRKRKAWSSSAQR